jgi:hypothetical protein
MTLTEALAVKARGLTKEQIIAHLRAVAEDNLRADIRTNRAGLEGKTIRRHWRQIGQQLKTTARPRHPKTPPIKMSGWVARTNY